MDIIIIIILYINYFICELSKLFFIFFSISLLPDSTPICIYVHPESLISARKGALANLTTNYSDENIDFDAGVFGSIYSGDHYGEITWARYFSQTEEPGSV